jgi:CelD/BcsL family acetyltransferase involved in cellulose biosynthesis
MGWKISAARSAYPAFASEWDRLNAELYCSHPFFDSRFVAPLLEFFGNGSEQLCVHTTSATVDGALMLRPLGLGRWALFLPSQAQAGPVLLRDARLLETLMVALPGHAFIIELLALDPKYSPNWSGFRKPQTIVQHGLTMAVALGGRFEDYWESRPRHLASNIRRYQRRSQEQFGTPTLVTITNPQQIAEAVARYGALELAGWKGLAGTAVSVDNVQGRFYEKTLRSFANSGQARVAELHIDGKLAASRLIISHDRMCVMLKTTYDESLAAMAPGRQLLCEVLRQAFSETRSGTIEFYTNTTRDQAEWATTLRYLRHHQLYRNDSLAVAYSLGKRLCTSLTSQTPEPSAGKTEDLAPLNVKTYQSIHDLPPEAIRLFEDNARHNVEFSASWFDNLQQTVFTDSPGVRHYVAEFDGLPSAILPFRLTRQGPIRQIESLSNYYTSLYSPILSPECTALDLIPLLQQANRDHAGGAHVMRFFPMDPDSSAYEALLAALRTIGWIPFRYFCFGNWFLKVEDNWAEYLKKRSGPLRSTIKRMTKKFGSEGGTFEIITDPALAEPAISVFKDVYALSWKKPEPYPDFIPGLIRWLAARGELRLGIARLAGRPIAAQLWIISHGKASIFKLAYDEAFSVFSPGTLLTAHLMEHAIDHDGVQEVDYLIGDDEYKQSWMSHRRERWGIVAYNPHTLLGAALFLREAIGRALRHVLHRPNTTPLPLRLQPTIQNRNIP